MSACTALANCPGPGHLLNITAFDGLQVILVPMSFLILILILTLIVIQGGVEDFNEDLLASVCSGLVCGGRSIKF